jgi:hypothetical protein
VVGTVDSATARTIEPATIRCSMMRPPLRAARRLAQRKLMDSQNTLN